MKRILLPILALFANVAAAATYDVTISWAPDPIADTFDGWCSTSGLPDTTKAPSVSAAATAKSVSLDITAAGGETLSCVGRQRNSEGPGLLSDVASTVLAKQVPGKTTIFLEVRSGP